MSCIDYAELHKIAIPEDLMPDIYALIEPETYLRLFNKSNIDNEKKNESNKDKNSKSAYKEQLNENMQLMDLLKEEQNRVKNLMSLSLLYQRIRKAPYRNGYCSFVLNTLLTFELYITLSHWINYYESKKEKVNEKMAMLEPLNPEYHDFNEEWTNYENKIEKLVSINNTVVRSLRFEHIYALTIEYQKFTPREHAQKCLL